MNLVSGAGLLGVTLVVVLTVGCANDSSKDGKKDEKQTGSAKAELQIKVPETGR